MDFDEEMDRYRPVPMKIRVPSVMAVRLMEACLAIFSFETRRRRNARTIHVEISDERYYEAVLPFYEACQDLILDEDGPEGIDIEIKVQLLEILASEATLEIEEMAEYFGGSREIEVGRRLLGEARKIREARHSP